MKPPAFLGLMPQPPRYDYLATDKCEWLSKQLELTRQWQVMQGPHTWPMGFYRDKEAEVFVKVLPIEQELIESFVHRIESELVLAGVQSRLGCLRQVTYAEQNFLAVVYPYWHGHFFQNSTEQVVSIAYSLKQVHQVMKTSSLTNEVKKNWQARLKTWKKTLSQVSLYNQVPVEAEVLLIKYAPIFEQLCSEPAQIVHGDMNIGNVLFYRSQAVVIDLENSHYSYLSINFDLAMVVERFCLSAKSEEQAAQWVRIFLLNYGCEKFDLVHWMICVSYRSLLVLMQACADGDCILASEWQKFVSLIQSAHGMPAWFIKTLGDDVWQN
jgi:thiamine kinase-like enzyme